MKIVVLAGGLSPERDVSLTSGSLIANALREADHEVVLLDVYEGLYLQFEDVSFLFGDKTAQAYSYSVPEQAPNLEEIKRRNHNGKALIGPNVIKICQYADVVFLALHGAMGENGQIQALFDVLGITYTGSSYIGSLLAMDKDLSKQIMKQNNLPTAPWVTLVGEEIGNVARVLDQVGLPCVVKPCSCGSSIGISMAETEQDLIEAMAAAGAVEDKILIEKKISGREFSVGILDGKALPVIEIMPVSGFYDYKNKYQAGGALEQCPADLEDHLTEELKALALGVHKALLLGDYSRVDFLMDEDHRFYCLEANTLPGMTPTSLLPQEAAVIGYSYQDLCNLLVTLAVKKEVKSL